VVGRPVLVAPALIGLVRAALRQYGFGVDHRPSMRA
jgi:hypothetical protein